MNKKNHGHHPHGAQDHDNAHRDHRPFWKRAHRDWRLWGAVILMLGAMVIYLMSDDLRWRPRNQPQQPLSGAVGK